MKRLHKAYFVIFIGLIIFIGIYAIFRAGNNNPENEENLIEEDKNNQY